MTEHVIELSIRWRPPSGESEMPGHVGRADDQIGPTATGRPPPDELAAPKIATHKNSPCANARPQPKAASTASATSSRRPGSIHGGFISREVPHNGPELVLASAKSAP